MVVNKKVKKETVRATPTGGTKPIDQTEECSIANLEIKIEELKSSPKAKNKVTIEEIKRLQSALNKKYIEYKQKVLDFEKENFSHLVFLRSTHGFHKLMGNSLFFYAFDIAPKLNIDVKIYSDNDYETKSEAGITSIRSLSELEKNLKKLGIFRKEIIDKTGNIVIYKLPWDYSAKEIERFNEQNTYTLNKYNHVIMAENVIPVLFLNLSELMKVCYENVRRLEPVARETLGNYIIEATAEMIRIYIEMSNGRLSEMEALKHIRLRVNKIKSQIKILTDLKLWNARVYARIGEILIKVQEIVDLQLKK